MRAEISLGDLSRALGYLAPTDADTGRRIAKLLGLSAVAAFEAPTTADAGDPTSGAAPAGPIPSPPRAPTKTTSSKRPKPPLQPLDPREERPRASSLRKLGGQPPRRLPRRVAPLEQLLASESPDGDRTPAFPPDAAALLTPRWRRAVLTTALATPAPVGPLDVDRLVERIAHGEAISDLPRLPVPTLERGADVFIDSREGLTPFAADQRRFAAAVVAVLGRDQARVKYFSGCPGRGVGEGSVLDWQPYQPAADGRPVLMLTDLGIGARGICRDRAEVSEWAAFADRLRAAGNPLVAFVPYPPRRWPRRLGRRMLLVHWDRSVGVTAIRRRSASLGAGAR